MTTGPRVAAAAVLLFAFAPLARAEAPRVVASIKPVHSLVAAVMVGVGEPALLVGGASSPHTYTLRPSDATKLDQARLVFWVGPIYEGFLAKPLAALDGRAAIVELDKAAGVTVLPARKGGAWEPEAEPHAHAAAEDGDGHLWLDPANGKAILRVAAERLAALDPANAERYAANATAAAARLDELDRTLAARLAPVRNRPFVVFHDAYQYFERHYGLAAIGSITVNPENRPSARRLQELRDRIESLGVRCVFSEPQFAPALVRTITEGTKARTGVLDPLGAALPDGPSLYPALLQGLAESLVACLGASG